MTIRILDLTAGRFYPGIGMTYPFSTGSYPARGVKAVGEVRQTMEAAYADAIAYVHDYEAKDTLGNMGQPLGVTRVGDGYRGVVNTYHSNS